MAGRPSRLEERRADILEATKQLLLDRDRARSLRLPDIAGELDMTPNAVRYYYRGVDEILQDIYNLSVERFYTRRTEALTHIEGAALRLATTLAAGLPTSAEDTEWSLMWRALVTSTMELNQSSVVTRGMHLQVAMYESILEDGIAAGEFVTVMPTRDIARTLIALEDYFGFRVVAHDVQFDRAEALRLLRQYAELATQAKLPEVP